MTQGKVAKRRKSEDEKKVQCDFMETVGIVAAKKILDPSNVFEWEAVLDGLGADLALYDRKTTHYTSVQVKTGTTKEATASEGYGKVHLNCKRSDSAIRGKYEYFVIIGVIFSLDIDQRSVLAERTGFNMIPEKY